MIGHVLEKELFVGVKLYPVVFAAGPETVTFTVPVLIHRARSRWWPRLGRVTRGKRITRTSQPAEQTAHGPTQEARATFFKRCVPRQQRRAVAEARSAQRGSVSAASGSVSAESLSRQRSGQSSSRLGQQSRRLGHRSEARSAQRQARLCPDSASVCADHDSALSQRQSALIMMMILR
jgi:hypothetical protein